MTVDAQAASDLARQVRVGIEAEPFLLGTHSAALAALAELQAQAEAAQRAIYLATHLFQMIDPETWRAQGGDDGQGHYEGDYWAAQTADELRALAAAAPPPAAQEETA